jgi:hypothetical protein
MRRLRTIAAALALSAAITSAGTTLALAGEDGPGPWSCATQGNKVCGPGHGPNTTDHNVYYGSGLLPLIPGRLTTWPDGTRHGARCLDDVFAGVAWRYPHAVVMAECR